MESWEDRVEAICMQGNEYFDLERYLEAIQRYDHAWDLLPEPKPQWRQSTWILASIGDAYVQHGDFVKAHEALTACMHCPGALGNPFIHFRLGQAQFELGNLPRAADELMRAYMGAGPEIFADEDPSTSTSSPPKPRTSSGPVPPDANRAAPAARGAEHAGGAPAGVCAVEPASGSSTRHLAARELR